MRIRSRRRAWRTARLRAARRVHRARSRSRARRRGSGALRRAGCRSCSRCSPRPSRSRSRRIRASPQAREGFERENRAGLRARRAGSLLSRRQSQARVDLRAHAVSRAEPLPRARRDRGSRSRRSASRTSKRPLAALRDRPDRAGLAAFFAALWTLREPRRAALRSRARVEWARQRGGADPAARWVARWRGRHPRRHRRRSRRCCSTSSSSHPARRCSCRRRAAQLSRGRGHRDHGELRQRAARRAHRRSTWTSRSCCGRSRSAPARSSGCGRGPSRRGRPLRDAGRGVRARRSRGPAGSRMDRCARREHRDPAVHRGSWTTPRRRNPFRRARRLFRDTRCGARLHIGRRSDDLPRLTRIRARYSVISRGFFGHPGVGCREYHRRDRGRLGRVMWSRAGARARSAAAGRSPLAVLTEFVFDVAFSIARGTAVNLGYLGLCGLLMLAAGVVSVAVGALLPGSGLRVALTLYVAAHGSIDPMHDLASDGHRSRDGRRHLVVPRSEPARTRPDAARSTSARSSARHCASRSCSGPMPRARWSVQS